MEALFQVVVNGIAYGGVLALASSGMALLFGVMRIMNFAHGEMLALGAYGAYFGIGLLHWNPILVGVLIVVGSALLGAIIQRVIVGNAADHGDLQPVLITYGLHSILLGALFVIFTGEILHYPSPLAGVITIASLTISIHAVVVALVTAAAYGVLIFFLHRTKLGAAIRATAQHRNAASASGIDVSRIDALTFALSVALAALAGFLLSMQISISPQLGQNWLLQVLIVVVIGGLGSVQRALVGGLVVGLLWTIGNTVFGGSLSALLFYIVAYLILVVRGAQLFARERGFA